MRVIPDALNDYKIKNEKLIENEIEKATEDENEKIHAAATSGSAILRQRHSDAQLVNW